MNYHMIRLLVFVFLISFSDHIGAQVSLGTIQANTNAALPNSYNFQEYVYAELDDQGTCTGATNATASIQEVFFSQTHRQAIDHPFFFLIGHRPALLQAAIAGTGNAPDVQVQGILNGNVLGTLCLDGPASLSSNIDAEVADLTNYFSVTLPKSWVQDGLSLIVTAGGASQTINAQELNIGPYCEMNLVMVNQDVMDYNIEPHNFPIFNNFLEEVASSIPASVVRFGIFPKTLQYQEVIASEDSEVLLRLQSKIQVQDNPNIDDGFINSIAVLALGNMHRSTQDYISTVYFGNTLNLAPGGWGGGRNFVSPDFTDIFIHELGHALSLPHWGDAYNISDPDSYQYNYPFGGETGNGGGRGTSWNFIQDTYEFVSPVCQSGTNGTAGQERSDCMQRNHPCLESRPSGNGPWDGHGHYSAYAMYRYMTGASVVDAGQVFDKGALRDYQFSKQAGFANMTLVNNERVYTRDPQQPQNFSYEERFEMPGQEQINTDVYLIYGTVHPTQNQANIVYCPVKYNGTLPPIVDPTDQTTFNLLKGPPHNEFLYSPRDITLKVTYDDGTVLHAINPYHSFARQPHDGDFSRWRRDLSNFSLVVPADKDIQKVEVYNRPFCVRGDSDDIEGNINYQQHNITSANFMNGAIKMAEYDGPSVVGPNAIGNRVWHDYDRNGINDPNEPGIAGVSLALWGDSNDDNIPDGNAFMGVTLTDEEGYYRFPVSVGNFATFVWQVDNWGAGEPLHGFVSTTNHIADPNTDIDLDNNGSGPPGSDIMSGTITITATGEPLNDGDSSDCYFDNDPSGNMTIDFGFYDPDLFVWTGDHNDDWMNSSNWAGIQVPDASSDVLILSDRTFYPDIDETIQIGYLEVQKGAQIIIPKNLTFEVITPPSSSSILVDEIGYSQKRILVDSDVKHKHGPSCDHTGWNEYARLRLLRRRK